VDAFDVDTTTSTTTTSTPTPAPSTSTTGSTTTGASAATVTLAEQNNAAVRYTGNWFANSLPAHSGGTAALAVDKGAEASFTFTGTGASWIAYRDAWSGIAKVFVDGNMAGRIDTYSPTDSAQSVAYSITGLTPGTHTLTIKVCGQQDQSSGGAWVWVDAFKVTP
jgi:bacillopeptidase F